MESTTTNRLTTTSTTTSTEHTIVSTSCTTVTITHTPQTLRMAQETKSVARLILGATTKLNCLSTTSSVATSMISVTSRLVRSRTPFMLII